MRSTGFVTLGLLLPLPLLLCQKHNEDGQRNHEANQRKQRRTMTVSKGHWATSGLIHPVAVWQ